MDIFLHYILPPLVGALIGYITNWIAVKMLFRPLYPKYIGKWRLPFTPGIIPRRKDALAKAIGRAVGEELLTKEDIEKAFFGEEQKMALVSKLTEGASAVGEKSLISLIPSDMAEVKKAYITDGATEKILSALSDMQIGETIAEISEKAVLEKLKASPLGMFVSANAVHSIMQAMSGKIDEYLEEHGREKLLPVIEREIDGLSDKPINSFVTTDEMQSVLNGLYEKLLLPMIEEVVSTFDVAAQVEKKVSEMDVKELETLCLSVMKRELNAITWLGGLIGLLLGIINIFL